MKYDIESILEKYEDDYTPAIGPRAMVGEITNEKTQFGRPIYQTPSGEKVSEKSTTLFFNGNWINVPSIHGGKSFNEDELRLMIKRGNLQPTSVHKSKDDAEAAAKARSDSMVQGPRSMKLAQVPRSEMDNFNTPDLDQGADSILKPGETLEDDFDVEFRRPNAQGGRIDFNEGGDATRLKALEADYIQFGKKKLNKAAKVLGFQDYASMSGQENNNFRRKIKQQLTKYGEVLPKGYDSDVRGRKTRIPKEQNIQIKLLEETNKKNFFDPKQFAIDNDISLAKVKKQAERLQTNIYKKRMLEAGKDVGVTLEWIPKDPKFSDNTLNKLWKSKLIKYEREKIDELFYDAFGREKIKGTNKKNPSFNNKKFLAIKKNLNEYRKLRNGINAKYPNINFELDHPLSKSTLKKMFNASAEELTRVNPLEADLNNGFKDAVSQQYEKAMGDSKKGIKPNLNKKKAVEKIARDLKLNIGKINNDATNFKYGVKEFQKLNMKDEILKAVQNQEYLSSNFKTYVKNNPELFKTANVNPNTNITKIT